MLLQRSCACSRILGGGTGSGGVAPKTWPCVEVPGCGSVDCKVNGTGIMSVPGKVATEVGVSGGALSIWRISCADNWGIGSFLVAADFCSMESILSLDDDCCFPAVCIKLFESDAVYTLQGRLEVVLVLLWNLWLVELVLLWK